MRVILLALCVCWAGCGARQEVVLQRLDVSRVGWDTLIVSASFARKTTLGGARPIAPDRRRIVVFDATYDTLYAGTDTLFSIPDGRLGNAERMLVEACGVVRQLVVCDQHTLRASPKRIRLEPDIQYPLRKAVHEGRFHLPFTLERRAYHDPETWEELDPPTDLHGHILAYVEGKAHDAVRVPFNGNRGAFNLARADNYRDFKFYLDSALLDHQSASVHFDVYVDMDGFYEPVGSTTRAVAVMKPEEQQDAVARFARQAAEQIVDRLNPFLNGRRNTVYIDRWHYNPFKQMYSIEMEIAWSGSLFARSDYRLSGVLDVYEEGERAQFKKNDASRRAQRRWESRVDGTTMTLYPLNAPPPAAAERAGAFLPEDDAIVIEAEHFDENRPFRNQSWKRRNVRGARGDGAMVVHPDVAVRIRSGYDEKSPGLSYRIAFEKAGTYYLWLRVWAPDNNGNSVHAGLDGTAFRSARAIETTRYRRWTWTRSLDDDDDEARIDVFSPGVHTLNLWMREDGLVIDRIILTPDRYYTPRGSGPAESPRQRGDVHSTTRSTTRSTTDGR